VARMRISTVACFLVVCLVGMVGMVFATTFVHTDEGVFDLRIAEKFIDVTGKYMLKDDGYKIQIEDESGFLLFE
jgi:hypothetical protein